MLHVMDHITDKPNWDVKVLLSILKFRITLELPLSPLPWPCWSENLTVNKAWFCNLGLR
jgi:hypothetical protein